ncbi:hypothetical protein M2324_003105 [Rhodovulum sulfidophilum]|uniref:hypothetical protein n=1 Tax=Rhodovulum sulfidophilum TaxID=35806 RepID=UPI0018C860FD|nr:hypothetical protein [Rhodovulum sulfidophilum]
MTRTETPRAAKCLAGHSGEDGADITAGTRVEARMRGVKLLGQQVMPKGFSSQIAGPDGCTALGIPVTEAVG